MLLKLAITFLLMSVFAVGGGTALLSEMQHVLFTQYGITPEEFTRIYSVGQIAPGPNMTMVLILGMQIAGALGALIVGIAFFVPSGLLCFWVGRLWTRIGETPWRRAVQSAFEPISVGLMCSGVYALGKTALHGPAAIGLAIASLGLVLLTRIKPVIIILALAAAGVGMFHLQPP
jgi:chromate transporter